MSRLTRVSFLPFAFAISACAPETASVDEEAAATDSASAENAIEELRAGYESRYNAHDWEGLLAFYSDDYREFSPSGDADRAEIERALRDSTQLPPPDARLSIAMDDLVVAESGDVAYGYGTTTFTATGPDGVALAERARWMAGFREEGESWKLDRLVTVPAVADTMGAPDIVPTPPDTAVTM